MGRRASAPLHLAPGRARPGRRSPAPTPTSPARGGGRAVRRAALLAVIASACATGHPPAPPPGGTAAAVEAEAGATAPDASRAPAAEGALTAGAGGPREASPLAPDAPDAAAPAPVAPAVDALDLLWGHRLAFSPRGEPLVTIRLTEGQREIAFRPRGPARVVLRGGGAVDVPAGARLTVSAVGAVPAALVRHVLLADAPIAHRERLEPIRRAWEGRGVPVVSRIVGGVYGIRGRVVDNRRELLLVGEGAAEPGARSAASGTRTASGARPALHVEVVGRPRGTLELRAEGGAPLGEADAALWMDVAGGEGFVVEAVEHERGPAAARGREDRAYGGRLYVTIDAAGRLAAVHAVELEELLRGIVPSEIPASSHREALKAQAVAARSNVLAQIGTRHLTDPFMLCPEVHCQAYRGEAARTARTDDAIRATRGEVVFASADRTLVDAVYSAMCGGHGESNEHVWGNARSPSLRGRPDLPAAEAARWAGGLAHEARLRAFLEAAPDAWCRRPAAARRDRFRWERRFTRAELDRALAPLEVGRVRAIRVGARGVSGRARTLEVEGDAGRAEVPGELRIRRLLGNLPSAMFVVDPAVDGGVTLRGGGWGHGAGMCQWGAVGRAEAGQGYREILRAYYSGAEVTAVY